MRFDMKSGQTKCILEDIKSKDMTIDKYKDMFLAGSDTVALVLEWTMTELMKNPSKMKNAQEELRRVIGNKSKIEESDINQMNYLKCVIKESLRLHPVIPMPPRETTASCKLGGYDLPPKARVTINIWAIQRDPKHWESPEEFIPERHENSTVDYINQSNHFIPFGGGRRGCPGMSFGTANVECLLANLLCWFDWKMPGDAREEDLDTSEVINFVLRKKIPLNLVPLMHSH
ncbi:cytochrome P450 71A1-like [Tripterygium wilfordii]|uniref:Cytochrome P450 71A1-like n=1 Tax=Tripterygium wilfordii TaxID=458696 RepID=A0A7J7C9B0_TRIWF|nr:cytochrome P450 71A1-like [Tripterygium wilfordii]